MDNIFNMLSDFDCSGIFWISSVLLEIKSVFIEVSNSPAKEWTLKEKALD